MHVRLGRVSFKVHFSRCWALNEELASLGDHRHTILYQSNVEPTLSPASQADHSPRLPSQSLSNTYGTSYSDKLSRHLKRKHHTTRRDRLSTLSLSLALALALSLSSPTHRGRIRVWLLLLLLLDQTPRPSTRRSHTHSQPQLVPMPPALLTPNLNRLRRRLLLLDPTSRPSTGRSSHTCSQPLLVPMPPPLLTLNLNRLSSRGEARCRLISRWELLLVVWAGISLIGGSTGWDTG